MNSARRMGHADWPLGCHKSERSLLLTLTVFLLSSRPRPAAGLLPTSTFKDLNPMRALGKQQASPLFVLWQEFQAALHVQRGFAWNGIL